MLVGYARVSTIEQDTAMQLDALKAAGVHNIYQDKSSGVGPRPQLHLVLRRLRPGDTLVVWKIDRIARSLSDLLDIIQRVRNAGASIRSLTEPIDTSSSIGEFTLQILGAVAQLERSLIIQRTTAGIHAARARGVRWGRRPILSEAEQREVAELVHSGMSPSAIAPAYGISRPLVYRLHRLHFGNKSPTALVG
jgi:DNA invertase Pin-like site-specific DNA recombinase